MNKLNPWLEQVKNGEGFIVKDRNAPIVRVMSLADGEYLVAEEKSLVAAGLMHLPLGEKNDDFLDYPAPEVSLGHIRAAIQAERDEN